ncbi:hypothetical protein Tco_1120117 [Tanacetum coccineum]
MSFLTTTITSCFLSTNNQIRTSSNPRNQATIQDGRVIVQQVQGRHGLSFASMGSKRNATSSVINKNRRNNAAILARVVRYCDEAPCAKVVLMANLSSYDSNFISEVPISKTIQHNSVFYNDVQGKYYSEQPTFDPALDIEITSDSNIISYAQYLKETERLAFWLPNSNPMFEQLVVQSTPVKIEVPSELPKARIPFEVAMKGGRYFGGHGYKEVTKGLLEALELKGGDGGACKLLGRLLGDVIEVLEVLGC